MKKILGILILLGVIGVGSFMLHADAPGPIPINSNNYSKESKDWKEHHDYMHEFHNNNGRCGGRMMRGHGRSRGHHRMIRRR